MSSQNNHSIKSSPSKSIAAMINTIINPPPPNPHPHPPKKGHNPQV